MELIVTVAIVSILATIAYPSYQEHLRTTRRADAQGALLGLANAMERHFTVNNTYAGAAVGPADTGSPANYSNQVPVGGGTATYNLLIWQADATSFTLRADPIGVQSLDKCGTLTLTSTGVRGMVGDTVGNNVSACWR